MGVSPSTKNIKPYLSNNNKSLLEILKLLDDYYFPTDDRKLLKVELCSSKRYGHPNPRYLEM